ncbi:multiple epidermal growth factor-like domains protein 11 [Saccostrea cucullata]|uniref:multiple epidermal growth factor-like domains protein 11 n=1 Tax=Saccostrea cuccullata TaxID=36930 RepID=UPI002ED15D65
MLNYISLLCSVGFLSVIKSDISKLLNCSLWNDTKGTCKDCNPGFSGINCSQQCSYPNYGLKCQSFCNCPESVCDSLHGCSFNTTTIYPVGKELSSCSPGYFGINCSWPCRYPNYGENCQSECNCEKSFCNVTYGCNVDDVKPTVQTTFNENHDVGRADFSINMLALGSIVSVGFLLVIISIIVAAVICTKHISHRMQMLDKCNYPATEHHITNRSFDTSEDMMSYERRPVSSCDHLYINLT